MLSVSGKLQGVRVGTEGSGLQFNFSSPSVAHLKMALSSQG